MPRETTNQRATVEFRGKAEDRDGKTWVGGLGVTWESRNAYGEQFVPGAFAGTLAERSRSKPLVIRWLHRTPVGKWSEHAEERDGLRVGGFLSDTATARDEAEPLLRDEAVTGLSIGFWPTKWRFADAGEVVTFQTPFGERSYEPTEPTIFILEADLLEVSLVDAPADDDARIDELRDQREHMLTRARELGEGSGRDLYPDQTNPTRAAGGDNVDAPRRVQMPAENSAPIEALNKAVHDLTEIVGQMRDGLTDQATAHKALAEVVERQAEAVVEQNRRREELGNGYRPDDADSHLEDGAGRIKPRDLLMRTPKELKRASITRRVSYDEAVEFQQRSDDLVLLSALLKCDPRETRYYKEEYLPALRAVDSVTAGEGDEFVPTALSMDLIRRVDLPLRVAQLFPMIPMPTQPYELPATGVARVRTGKFTEQTADTGQDTFKKVTPATRKVTLSAGMLAAEVLFSKTVEEDSIIPILPFIQEEIVKYLAADIEDAIINGDTAGSHQDSDVAEATDPRAAITGLRKMGLAQAGTKLDLSSATTLTVAHLRSARAKMRKYGVILSDVVHIVGINSYFQLLGDTSVQTVDKYGPQATVLTGELAKVDGVPLVISDHIREDLNASGVYDGTTTTETTTITVNRGGFLQGERRGITTQYITERYANSDQDAMLITHRRALAARYPVASEPILCVGYNVDA